MIASRGRGRRSVTDTSMFARLEGQCARVKCGQVRIAGIDIPNGRREVPRREGGLGLHLNRSGASPAVGNGQSRRFDVPERRCDGGCLVITDQSTGVCASEHLSDGVTICHRATIVIANQSTDRKAPRHYPRGVAIGNRFGPVVSDQSAGAIISAPTLHRASCVTPGNRPSVVAAQ
jgi:hypothetical protein